MRRFSSRMLAGLVLCSGVLALCASSAGARLATAKLGPPPVECTSAQGLECAYGLEPLYMGETYNGGLHVTGHLLHQGETVTETFYPKTVKCISGEPCASSWGWDPPGEKVSPCESHETFCTFTAIYPSTYPPSEEFSGWSGGWDVDELNICGFNGCAYAYDYYYVVPENLRGLSGSVRSENGEPLRGATVFLQGSGGSESTEVDPTTGTYSFIVPPGKYNVSVEPPSGSEVHPVQCTTGRIVGGEDCEIDLTQKDGNASFIQGESASIVGTPKVVEPESGSTPEQFKIALSQASEEPVTVAWSTVDSSATTANNNYKAASGEVTIPPGVRSVPVSVDVLPGSGASRSPAIYFFAKITSILSGNVTLNQRARQALGTILVPVIHGAITGPPKNGTAQPLANVKVSLSGTADTGQSVTTTTETDAEGDYHFGVDPGKYTLTPSLTNAKGEKISFNTQTCEGTKSSGSCTLTLPVGSNAYTANFTGGFLLSGVVKNGEGKGVPGGSVSIEGPENSTLTTDGEGKFKAELQPGLYTVSVAPLNGTQYFPVPSEPPSEECVVSETSCHVNLKQDSTVEFTQCVLASPSGAPLPANTPDPIPGAITHGQLEAVGCFTHKPDGTDVSKRNVRLDGVDVIPTNGAEIVVDGTSVTSTGQVLVKVDGFTLLAPHEFHFTYGGSSVETNDISSNSPTLNVIPNFFGLPISLGSGGSIANPPLLQASTGKTTLTLAGQVVVPYNTSAKWDARESGFQIEDKTNNTVKAVPSVGLSGSVVTSNREGLHSGTFCGKLANLAPFGKAGGELSQAVLCYTPSKSEWSLQALYNLPGVAEDFVRQVNVMGVVQGSNSAEGLLGYRIQSVQLQARGIGATIPGTNGILLGDGVFWNGLGGGWVNDLSKEPAKLKSFNLTGALTFGPEIKGFALLSFDGQVKVSPEAENSKGEAIPRTYEAAGQLSAFHGAPFALPLGHGNVRFILSPASVEMEAELGIALGPVGGFKANASGFWDGKNQILQLDGLGSVSLGGAQFNAEGLISGTTAIVCLTGGNRAQTGSGFASGASLNLATRELSWFGEGTCDVGKYKHPKPIATASSAAGSSRAILLAAHLAGTVLAVKGVTGAPAIIVRGPGGLELQTSSQSPWLNTKAATVLRDDAAHTTYVVLHHPRGGRYKISTQTGSSPIKTVLQADPAARAKVSAHVSPGLCQRTLTYKARVPAGERVALYAKDGHMLSFLGYAHNGSKRASFVSSSTRGKGKILALETTSKGTPRSTKTVATFPLHALERPGRVSALRVGAHKLSWRAPCGAMTYTITLSQGKQTTTLSSLVPSVTLPPLHGAVTITVTAHATGGAGPPSTIKAEL